MVDQKDGRIVGRERPRGAVVASGGMFVSRGSVYRSADLAAWVFVPHAMPPLSRFIGATGVQDSRRVSFPQRATDFRLLLVDVAFPNDAFTRGR